MSEAHKRGLYVVQDIVINHLCDYQTMYSQSVKDHVSCTNNLDAQFWGGSATIADPSNQGILNFTSDFFGPLKSPYYFNRCGKNSPQETGSELPAAVYGDFVATMFDLATYNYDFQNIFVELYKPLLGAIDIDGFRLDAAKHVTEDFVAQISTFIRQYALSLGKKDFLVVGEVAGSEAWIGRRLGKMFSDPNNPADHGSVPRDLTSKLESIQSVYLANPTATYPGLNAVYDFDASGTSRGVFLGENPSSNIASYFASDYYNTIAGQADYRLSWTHLEIRTCFSSPYYHFIYFDAFLLKKYTNLPRFMFVNINIIIITVCR